MLVHQNPKATPEAFLETVEPYREGLVVAAECMKAFDRERLLATMN